MAAAKSKAKQSVVVSTGVSDYQPADYIIKSVIIGDSGVGKSCILKRFSSNQWLSDFYTTIGVDLEIKTVDIDGKLCKLQIWDTAGQERFRNITTSYYRGAHTIMVVFDVTNSNSFKNVPLWLQEVGKYAADDATVLLVGNKCDAPASQREVDTKEAKALADELKIPYLETSAKASVNVEEAFMVMARKFIADKFPTGFTPKKPLTGSSSSSSSSSSSFGGQSLSVDNAQAGAGSGFLSCCRLG